MKQENKEGTGRISPGYVPRATAPTRRRRPNPAAAMALVGTMLVLMLILSLALIGMAGGSGLSRRSDNALQSAKVRIPVVQATNLAETGIRATMQWLNELGGPPTMMTMFAPTNSAAGPGWTPFWVNTESGNYAVVNYPDPSDSTSQFKVRIYPHSDNGSVLLRSYVIESVGIYKGVKQVIRASVAQDTFAKYAFFTDSAPAGWFMFGNTAFGGPVHINNSDNKDINILWSSTLSPNNQIFKWNGAGALTVSGSSSRLKWHRDVATNNNSPSSSQWVNVAPGGKNTILTGADKITLPTSSTNQKDAALGGTTEPSGSGVTIPNTGGNTSGGIYIKGDVEDMVLEATGAGNRDQIIKVYQTISGKKILSTVRINASGTTTLTKSEYNSSNGKYDKNTTTTSYSGTTNGVVYSTGHIGSQTTPKTGGLSGTVANSGTSGSEVTEPFKLNIVTDATKNLNIDGDITYVNTPKTASEPTFGAGVLGIVSKTVQVIDASKVVQSTDSPDVTDGQAIKDITIHATVLAYDTFDVTNYDTRQVGDFTLLGGYIVKNSTSVGVFDGTTNTMMAGFRRKLNYDIRVANQPPPYFPGTGTNYKMTSYQRVTSTLRP
jgi:hypothetical protein